MQRRIQVEQQLSNEMQLQALLEGLKGLGRGHKEKEPLPF